MSAINVYEQQLLQIQQALEKCESEEDRANLISLQADLRELISLENLEANSECESDTNESLDEASPENSKKVSLSLTIAQLNFTP